MRFATVALLAACSSLGAAQLLEGLAECGRSCYEDNTGDCSTLDIGCICGTESLINSLSCCVAQNCNEADTAKVIEFANGICGTVGVTLPQEPSCEGDSQVSSSSAAASASASASESAAESSAAASASESASSAAETGTDATPTATADEEATPTGTSAEATGAAMQTGIGFGAAVVGLLAVL